MFQLNPYISIGLCYVYWDLGTTSPGNLYCSPAKHPNIVKLDLRSPKEMPGHLRSIGGFGRCIVNVRHCTCSDLFHNHGLTQHHRLSGSIWRMLCIYIYIYLCVCVSVADESRATNWPSNQSGSCPENNAPSQENMAKKKTIPFFWLSFFCPFSLLLFRSFALFALFVLCFFLVADDLFAVDVLFPGIAFGEIYRNPSIFKKNDGRKAGCPLDSLDIPSSSNPVMLLFSEIGYL